MLVAGSHYHLTDAVVAACSWKLWAPRSCCGRREEARGEPLTLVQAEKPHRDLDTALYRGSH